MGFKSVGHERIVVSTTAKSLTVPTPSARHTQKAEILVTDADIVYKTDGNTPTATNGGRRQAGDRFKVEGATDLANFKAIRQGSVDATLWVDYSQEEN